MWNLPSSILNIHRVHGEHMLGRNRHTERKKSFIPIDYISLISSSMYKILSALLWPFWRGGVNFSDPMTSDIPSHCLDKELGQEVCSL